MASTVWKGFITFGLISIPIRIFAAARNVRVSFHRLHKSDLARVRNKLYCPEDDKIVDRSEIVKGHEIEKGQWVVVEDEEIEAVAPESSDSMEILDVVKLSEVDPIYYESSYYAVPERAGRKAYSLLFETMSKAGLVAIAKLSMRRREYTVIIRPYRSGLALQTMHYAGEVRSVPEFEDLKPARVSAKERELAAQLLRNLESRFEPEKYHDRYRERLEELIEAKAKGKRVKPAKEIKRAPVIDLMAALEQSLKKGAARKAAQRAAEPVRKAG